jgi:hypothetical protein
MRVGKRDPEKGRCDMYKDENGVSSHNFSKIK